MLTRPTPPRHSAGALLLPALPLDCTLPALRVGAQALRWRAAGNAWPDISRDHFPGMATTHLIDLAKFALQIFPEWHPFDAAAEAFRASFETWQWGLRALSARGEKPIHTVLWSQQGVEVSLCACRAALGAPIESAEISTSAFFDLSTNEDWDRLVAFDDLLRAAIAVRGLQPLYDKDREQEDCKRPPVTASSST